MDEQKLTGWQVAGLLIKAPLMGALFVMFLPFLGIGMVLWYGGKTLWERGANVEHRLSVWMRRRLAH